MTRSRSQKSMFQKIRTAVVGIILTQIIHIDKKAFMKTAKLVISFAILLCVSGCSHKEFDAKYAAEKYCNCLKLEKKSGHDFFAVRATCDAKLVLENRFLNLTT